VAKVFFGGLTLDDIEAAEAIRRRDPSVTRALVEQIRADAAARVDRSEGLVVLSVVLRSYIVAYLRKHHFRGDDSTVEEVWNDTLLRVYTRIEAFDEHRGSFLTWVFSQATYAAADARRRLRTPADSVATSTYDEQPEPMSDAEHRALTHAFARLSVAEQRLLRLRYVFEFRNVEIARERLAGEIPEEHVRVYVNRALTRLRAFFDEAIEQER
jgi:RNA polymerase sigma factor (sigma-70 family)